MKCEEKEPPSGPNVHVPYLPFADLSNLYNTFADHPCDNAPDEKGIRWNRLMYW